MLPEDEFKKFCTDRYCPRGVLTNEDCLTEQKQSTCYRLVAGQTKKPERAVSKRKPLRTKIKPDERWKRVREEVFTRDGCDRVWLILTEAERDYILKNYAIQYSVGKRNHDPAHIHPRGSDQKGRKYDPSQIVRTCRFFHDLLEQYKNPVTQTTMTYEERTKFMEEARDGIRTTPPFV